MSPYLLLADLVLAVHVAVVAFVVGGLLLVVAGNAGRARWPWVNRPVFRWAHLAAIGIVAAQAWAGVVCPLTTLEMALRARAGAATYDTGLIAHWLQRLLYWDAPWWVFALAYTAFLGTVAAAWWKWPPRRLA